VNKSRKEYSKYMPSMPNGTFLDRFNDMSKYIVTNKYSTTSTQTDTLSLARGSTTWTSNNNDYVQSNVNAKFYQGLCPMC
jgi:hypothetical protein